MRGIRGKCVSVGVVVAALLAVGAAPAWSTFRPGPPPVGSAPRGDVSSEMIMSGTGAGGFVDGFIGPPGSTSDPSVPYPAAPPAGFVSHPEGFGGVIFGAPTGGGATLSLYCIDILTLTYSGIGYNLGTWDASNVDNVGYVAYLLNNYYPNVPTAPASLANDSERAAAVQASIWYFSDNYVLSTTDPLRPAVAAIVEDARTNGPLVQPPPPNLQITPAAATGPIGTLVGPYTITSPQGPATLSATGADMFSDAAGTTPIADGDTVNDGAQIWLERTTVGPATLAATASAMVPSGNVFLYSGNFDNVNDAQRLILAEVSTLTTTVSAAADFVDPPIDPEAVMVQSRFAG